MAVWTIYHKDGTCLCDVDNNKVEIHSLEYSDTWMGECYITTTIENDTPIEFSIGDYIMYRGDRYEINYDPGKIKCSSPRSYGSAFKYENVKFNAMSDELVRCEMLDVVLGDNELHYTALPKFSFYVQSIDDLLDRIQANLNEQIGEDVWHLYSRNLDRSVQRGGTKEQWLEMYGDEDITDSVIDSTSITIDSQTCWDALSLVNSQFDINFITRGRNVYVGTVGIPTANIFKYGKGNGLYEIEQTSESDQNVITRLRAYGSEQNLPTRYYSEIGIKHYTNITVQTFGLAMVLFKLDITFDESYFKTKRIMKFSTDESAQTIDGQYVVTITFDFDKTLLGCVYEDPDSKECVFYSSATVGNIDEDNARPSEEDYKAFVKSISTVPEKMYFVSGVKKSTYPTSRTEYDNQLPNNMAVNRLMLPGFPKQSLQEYWDSLSDKEKQYANPTGKEHKFSTDKYRPYIDSINADAIGVRQGSVFFDTDDKTNGIIEIYPSIEEMEIDGQRVDEIYEGSSIEDNGVFDDGETVPKFSIKLRPEIDFDITDLKQSDFSISMKDGMCGGRSFGVTGTTKENGVWKLTLERVKDDALDLYFPYCDYQINAKDHFVLTGIELPESYVKWNALKMLKYAIAYLDANDYTRFVYQPKVDELFMARQHDEAIADTTGTKKSLHDTLKAGDIMQFKDGDLLIDGKITIDQLTIKETDGKIPTYDITLREDKEVGTIQKIQNQISSLFSGNGSSGGGATPAQVKNILAAEGAELFLSRLNADVSQGLITFLSGLALGGDTDFKFDEKGLGWLKMLYLKGIQVTDSIFSDSYSYKPSTGFVVTDDDGSGLSYMEIDKLYVRYKAVFDELEIRKRTYVGGNAIFSNAASKLIGVEWLNSDGNVTDDITNIAAFKCYIKTDDGTTQTENLWKVGDLALCQTFNIKTGTTKNATNKVYWRQVLEVGDDYFTLSNKEGEYKDFGVDHSKDAELYQGTKVLLAGSDTIETEDELLTAEDGNSYMPSDFPEKEDTVVQFGSKADGRGNVVEILTYTPNVDSPMFTNGVSAPALIQYKGINNFSVDGKAKTVIAPSGNRFTAKSFTIDLDGERTYQVPIDFGEWVKGTEYPYYARVSHNGSLWLLSGVNETATSMEEPTSKSKVWVEQVAKGENGKDGNSLNVKGKIVKHYKNFTTFKNNVKERHGDFDSDDAYYEMNDGTIIKEYDNIILDSSADYSEEDKDEVDMGYDDPTVYTDGAKDAPSIAEFYPGDSHTDWTISQPQLNDAYMDNDGNLWVAGTKAWTNVGAIKGEKGDKGDDADWYEVVFTRGNGDVISSIALNNDDTSKLPFFVCRLRHYIGSTFINVTSGDSWTATVGGVMGRIVYLQNLKITEQQVTCTCTYQNQTYSASIPFVKDGDTGDNGTDATDFILTPETLVFDTDDDGNITTTPQSCILQLRRGDTKLTCVAYGTALEEGKNYYLDTTFGYANIEEGSVTTAIDSSDAKITIDPSKIIHYTKDKISFPYTDGYVIITIHTASLVLTKRIPWRVNYAKYVGNVAWTQKDFNSTFEAYKSTTDGTIASMQTSISQNAESINLKVNTEDMTKAGITLNADGVELLGSKVTVKNGDDTAALFADGKLNANLIEVTHLYATKTQADGTKIVQGHFGAVDDNTTYPFWIGATKEKQAEAPARINIDGEAWFSNAHITGDIEAQGGNVGGFKIDKYTSLSAGTRGTTNYMYLSSGVIRFLSSDGTIDAKFGSTTLIPSSGWEQCPLSLIKKKDYTAGTIARNIGIHLDVEGDTPYRDTDDWGNHALYIEHGDIYGFRLHHRRFTTNGATVNLNGGDGLVSIYGEGISVNVPSSPDDGMTIIVHNHSLKNSYIKGATFKRIYSYTTHGVTTYKEESVSGLTILPGGVMILTYDVLNNFWIGGQFMN